MAIFKIELNEKTENLLKLMDKSKHVALRRFAFEVLNFKCAVKPLSFKSGAAYTSYSTAPATILSKNNSHVFKSNVKVKDVVDENSKENKTLITFKSYFDTNVLQEMILEVGDEACKLVSKVGRDKEEYTFKFNDKKIYDYVDVNKQKEEKNTKIRIL